MNKKQLACQAVVYLYEHPEEFVLARQRMLHTQNNGAAKQVQLNSSERFQVNEVLSKKYGVSTGYIKRAKKLHKENFELFQLVLNGEATLPGNRPTKKEDTGEVFLALYRAYDTNGKLLYIGKTWNMKQRMNSHTGTSKWWDEFVTMTVDRNFGSYEELSKAETLAIRQEQPYYNMQSNWYN